MTVWAGNIQCDGNGAICEGTEERDTIQGAFTWDQILAHGGDDVVRGGGDGDSIQGETGDDRPYGDQCSAEPISLSKLNDCRWINLSDQQGS